MSAGNVLIDMKVGKQICDSVILRAVGLSVRASLQSVEPQGAGSFSEEITYMIHAAESMHAAYAHRRCWALVKQYPRSSRTHVL